ncbi:hypothetical protein V6N11_031852 [Hibiscus sabdariffa]|uniref:Uncharacterized protein n=1 Tax=Hibiscus sabdariffa TaxID=183260 RepID=A0ABR2SZF9_9ROSI
MSKSNNCSACLYTVTLDGRAVTSCYPLSQGSLPYKSKLSCIFLAAETLSIPISRRSLPRQGTRQVTNLMPWRGNLLPWLGGKSSASTGIFGLGGKIWAGRKYA